MLENIKQNWKGLLVSTGIALGVGFVSFLLSGNMKEYYNTLNKPNFAPSGMVFGIVWPILYVGMGISSYIVFKKREGDENAKKGLIFYLLQLAVNFSWSIVFFRFHLLWPSVLVIMILFILASMMFRYFYKVDKFSAFLQIPYLAWLLFACYLNLGVAMLN